jgi:cyanophycinase
MSLRFAWILACFAVVLGPQLSAQGPIGPSRGTIIAVGGGSSPDVLARFIEAAGGPEALILFVPTASAPTGKDFVIPGLREPGAPLKAAGAKNVLVLHTFDHAVANSDSFVEPINRAGGVWFGGGMPERIMDAYAGTKAEEAFRNVLSRGGVLGGTSAGAVVLASDFAATSLNAVTGERTPRTAFGFLRGVAIQPHARTPQPESWMLKRPNLLRIAADEPTAWVVQGDNAEIIGRGRAFVYEESSNGSAATFITLRAGDRCNLATRTVRRAIEGSSLTEQFVDSLFAEFAKRAAGAVLVAQDGKILIDKSYNIRDQPQQAPPTTPSNFALGRLADMLNAIAVQLLAGDGKLSLDDALADGKSVTIRQYFMRKANLPDSNRELARLIAKNIDVEIPQGILDGMRWGTTYGWFVRQRLLLPANAADSTTGEFQSNVDELYGWELALENPRLFTEGPRTFNLSAPLTAPRGGGSPPDATFGWQNDTVRGLARFSLFGANGGRRNAFARIPEKHISVIVLTNNDDANAQAITERITDRLISRP